MTTVGPEDFVRGAPQDESLWHVKEGKLVWKDKDTQEVHEYTIKMQEGGVLSEEHVSQLATRLNETKGLPTHELMVGGHKVQLERVPSSAKVAKAAHAIIPQSPHEIDTYCEKFIADAKAHNQWVHPDITPEEIEERYEAHPHIPYLVTQKPDGTYILGAKVPSGKFLCHEFNKKLLAETLPSLSPHEIGDFVLEEIAVATWKNIPDVFHENFEELAASFKDLEVGFFISPSPQHPHNCVLAWEERGRLSHAEMPKIKLLDLQAECGDSIISHVVKGLKFELACQKKGILCEENADLEKILKEKPEEFKRDFGFVLRRVPSEEPEVLYEVLAMVDSDSFVRETFSPLGLTHNLGLAIEPENSRKILLNLLLDRQLQREDRVYDSFQGEPKLEERPDEYIVDDKYWHADTFDIYALDDDKKKVIKSPISKNNLLELLMGKNKMSPQEIRNLLVTANNFLRNEQKTSRRVPWGMDDDETKSHFEKHSEIEYVIVAHSIAYVKDDEGLIHKVNFNLLKLMPKLSTSSHAEIRALFLANIEQQAEENWKSKKLWCEDVKSMEKALEGNEYVVAGSSENPHDCIIAVKLADGSLFQKIMPKISLLNIERSFTSIKNGILLDHYESVLGKKGVLIADDPQLFSADIGFAVVDLGTDGYKIFTIHDSNWYSRVILKADLLKIFPRPDMSIVEMQEAVLREVVLRQVLESLPNFDENYLSAHPGEWSVRPGTLGGPLSVWVATDDGTVITCEAPLAELCHPILDKPQKSPQEIAHIIREHIFNQCVNASKQPDSKFRMVSQDNNLYEIIYDIDDKTYKETLSKQDILKLYGRDIVRSDLEKAIRARCFVKQALSVQDMPFGVSLQSDHAEFTVRLPNGNTISQKIYNQSLMEQLIGSKNMLEDILDMVLLTYYFSLLDNTSPNPNTNWDIQSSGNNEHELILTRSDGANYSKKYTTKEMLALFSEIDLTHKDVTYMLFMDMYKSRLKSEGHLAATPQEADALLEMHPEKQFVIAPISHQEYYVAVRYDDGKIEHAHFSPKDIFLENAFRSEDPAELRKAVSIKHFEEKCAREGRLYDKGQTPRVIDQFALVKTVRGYKILVESHNGKRYEDEVDQRYLLSAGIVSMAPEEIRFATLELIYLTEGVNIQKHDTDHYEIAGHILKIDDFFKVYYSPNMSEEELQASLEKRLDIEKRVICCNKQEDLQTAFDKHPDQKFALFEPSFKEYIIALKMPDAAVKQYPILQDVCVQLFHTQTPEKVYTELVDKIAKREAQKAVVVAAMNKVKAYIGEEGKEPDALMLKGTDIGMIPSKDYSHVVLFSKDDTEFSGVHSVRADVGELLEDEFARLLQLKVSDLGLRQSLAQKSSFTQKANTYMPPPPVLTQEETEALLQIKLSELEVLFDAINFTDPAKPGYHDPKTLMDDVTPITVDSAKDGIRNFIQRVQAHDPTYYGTPTNADKSTTYYSLLEQMTKTIILKLKDMQKTDPDTFTRCLLDLAVAGKHCGGHFGNATDYTYRLVTGQLSKDPSSNIEEDVLRLMNDLKLGVVDAFIANVAQRLGSQIDPTHMRNFVFKVMNEAGVNLPGQELLSLDDEYESIATNAIDHAYEYTEDPAIPVQLFYREQFSPQVLADRVQDMCLEHLTNDRKFASSLTAYFINMIQSGLDKPKELAELLATSEEDVMRLATKLKEEDAKTKKSLLACWKQRETAPPQEELAKISSEEVRISKQHLADQAKIVEEYLDGRNWLYFDTDEMLTKQWYRISYEACNCILKHMGLIAL